VRGRRDCTGSVIENVIAAALGLALLAYLVYALIRPEKF
jgi:K+-transporting ATPase KdpF subunit